GHGLRRVLDAADRAQTIVRAQRIVGEAVAARRAADATGIPMRDGIEQTHTALVREVGEQPGVI
ncbi:MAG: hypothetical protein WBX11_18000, partial [Thiobacillaceae bacterium]